MLKMYLRFAFWLACVVVSVLALVPGEQLPPVLFDWWDKAQHTLAFLVLAGLGVSAYPTKLHRVGFGLLLFGGLIEIAQASTGWRTGDMQDWLADAIGIILVFALRALLKSWAGTSAS